MKLPLCMPKVLCVVKDADFSCGLGGERHTASELREPSAQTAQDQLLGVAISLRCGQS